MDGDSVMEPKTLTEVPTPAEIADGEVVTNILSDNVEYRIAAHPWPDWGKYEQVIRWSPLRK